MRETHTLQKFTHAFIPCETGKFVSKTHTLSLKIRPGQSTKETLVSLGVNEGGGGGLVLASTGSIRCRPSTAGLTRLFWITDVSICKGFQSVRQRTVAGDVSRLLSGAVPCLGG